ncbi:MAG: tetratricopeptide repeat protein [Bacteroidaceae bacterium]
MAEQKNSPEEGMNVEDALGRSEAFIIKNKAALIGVIIAAIVLIAGVVLYKHFISEPNQIKASEAIFKGEQYFGQDAYELALNGDSLGYKGFVKVADEFSGTKSGELAKAYAGICYAQLGKYNEAIKYLDGFDADDQMISPAMLGTLGNCYAQLNQLDKATDALLKAAERADNPTLSPIYLIQAGLIFEKQGKMDDAIKAYTQVKDKYFDSYQSMDIDKYIERATASKK